MRASSMPASLRLVDALRADGVPAVVSGAGPTVLAFVDGSTRAAVEARVPSGWQVRALAVDRDGVRVTARG